MLKKIKKLQFPLGQYVVVGSGIMDVLGIRKARDIDIVVTLKLYNDLRATKKWKEEEHHGEIFLKQNGIDIIQKLEWDEYTTTTQEAILSAVLIGGVPFMNLEELKKFKTSLGRKKDFKDIYLIDQYLSKQ